MADRIDQIDERLSDWVNERVDVPTVSFDPPGEETAARGVSLFLLSLEDAPPPRTTKRAPLQLLLRYLVTTWAESPQEAHRILDELVFDAMQADAFDVELTAPADTLWRCFAATPQPSFFLHVPCRRERPRPEIPRVRQPLVLETGPLGVLIGQVLGPGEMPIAGAIVELPALNTRTETDRRGAFRLDGVPQQAAPERVVVRARGTTSETWVDPTAHADAPLTIHIDPER